jgi:predicted ester cyclase
MSQQNVDFIHRWYAEVWNNKNEDAIDELLHPEVKVYGLGAEALVGPGAFKPFYRNFLQEFGDVRVDILKTIAEGNYITALCNVTATHIKTGKPVAFTGTSIGEIIDGKLLTGWNHFDFLTMYIQIGKIMPEQLA